MSDTSLTCPRCGAELVRHRRAENVHHYACPAPDCLRPREPRWRFALGLGRELLVMILLVAYALVRGVLRLVWRLGTRVVGVLFPGPG